MTSPMAPTWSTHRPSSAHRRGAPSRAEALRQEKILTEKLLTPNDVFSPLRSVLSSLGVRSAFQAELWLLATDWLFGVRMNPR